MKVIILHGILANIVIIMRGIPRGEIFWDEPETLIKDGIITIIVKGECPYCGESYIKCQGCGEVIHVDDSMKETECMCGNVFSVESEYIGEGMAENRIFVKSQTKEKPKFVPPNQIKLFE